MISQIRVRWLIILWPTCSFLLLEVLRSYCDCPHQTVKHLIHAILFIIVAPPGSSTLNSRNIESHIKYFIKSLHHIYCKCMLDFQFRRGRWKRMARTNESKTSITGIEIIFEFRIYAVIWNECIKINNFNVVWILKSILKIIKIDASHCVYVYYICMYVYICIYTIHRCIHIYMELCITRYPK